MLTVLVVLFAAVLPLLDALLALLVFAAVGRRIAWARLLSVAVAATGVGYSCCCPSVIPWNVPIRPEEVANGILVLRPSLLFVTVHYLCVGCLVALLVNALVNKTITPPDAPPPPPPPPPPVPREPTPAPPPTDFSGLPRYPG